MGEVIKPLGLKGGVLIKVVSDNPDRFTAGGRMVCLTKQGDRRQRVLGEVSSKGPRVAVRFEGIGTREQAELTRGDLMFVPVEDLPDLDQDSFWPHELIGAEVITPSGELVGSVVEVLEGADQDLLRVATSRGEALVPMVKEIITNIDPSRRVVTVDLPEGLTP